MVAFERGKESGVMHYESIQAFENDKRAPQRGDTIQASCGKALWFYNGGSRWDLLTETFLDLSPLQKFMGRPRKRFVSFLGVAPRMYGMDYDFDWVPPAPSPEKSPQEKALEDFIAKRKAKREGAGVFGGIGRDAEDAEMRRAIKEEADGRILDRAMRRLSFHEQDIHTRLMPYRREE